MKNKIIKEREDGFVISYATFKDFKNLKILVKNLSKESRCIFTPWLFEEKPTFKKRIGQIIAPLSLIPIIQPLTKKIFPMAYLVILQVKSPQSKVAGFVYLNRFQKLSKGYFSAYQSTVVADDFQGKGLGTFLRNHLQQIAKQENLGIMKGSVFVENKKSLAFYEKNGFKVEKIERNVLHSCGKKHDVVRIAKKYF